jgi:hypothetical protein
MPVCLPNSSNFPPNFAPPQHFQQLTNP